jgi:hypothetical protein
MKLSEVYLGVGGAHALAGLALLLKPAAAGEWLRAFPRKVGIGMLLMLAGTAWFVSNLYRSEIQDFAEWRPVLYGGFGLLGVGCCIFVQDYLSVRGACVLALLACDLVLDVRRPSDNPWSLVLSFWSYAVIVCAVWWVGSPWRVRDLTAWLAASPSRVTRLGAAVAAFGAAVALLSLTERG